LLALKSYVVFSRVVLQCGDSIQELALSRRVRLVWVPGHMHMRRLTWGRNLVISWHLRVSSGGSGTGYLNHIGPHGPHCHQSRIWLKTPNPGLTRYLLRLPRSKLRILIRLITGHYPKNKHLHNMGLIDEPICITCGMEDDSALHLLRDCPSLMSIRGHDILSGMMTYLIKGLTLLARKVCVD
jgi:hypothetical protein